MKNFKKIAFCILEVTILNYLVFLIFYKLSYNHDSYLRLNPHPALLICMAMGMRYGNYLGILCALISSAFYAYVFYNLHYDIFLLFASIQNSKYILLFFWSSMILGTFKDNKDESIQKLKNENALIKMEYKKLGNSYRLRQKILDELKKQIVGSEESILHLYEIASKLETLDSEEIYTETIGILSKYLKADTVSVYVYNQSSGYLRLKIRRGENFNRIRSLRVVDSHGFSSVVFEKRIVRLSDMDEAIQDFPLMSAPIIKDGQVIAIVNVESMDFDAISEYAYQLFKLIVEWVNKALERAIYVDNLRDSSYIGDTLIMNYEAFKKRLDEENRRKREFSMEYGLLEYHLEIFDLDSFSEAAKRFLRDVDIVSYDFDNNILYILLPATPPENLSIVDERIRTKLLYKFQNANLS